MEDLTGRMCFITGGANGIGLAMARAFAAEGATLALADIDAIALERAAGELGARTKVETFVLDVSDRDGYAVVADDAEERLGPIGVLCNNAAGGLEVPLAEMSYDVWDMQLDVTLGGVVNGIQTFLPRMLERGLPGHVVNTASQAGLVASHGGRKYMYNTAKFGVVGLSEALVQAVADTPIGVTLLCPGYVATATVENGTRRIRESGLEPAAIEAMLARLGATLGRMAELGRDPDEVGRLVADAVLSDRFYVHTANRVAEVTRRMQAIVESMPEESDHDRALAAYVAR